MEREEKKKDLMSREVLKYTLPLTHKTRAPVITDSYGPVNTALKPFTIPKTFDCVEGHRSYWSATYWRYSFSRNNWQRSSQHVLYICKRW